MRFTHGSIASYPGKGSVADGLESSQRESPSKLNEFYSNHKTLETDLSDCMLTKKSRNNYRENERQQFDVSRSKNNSFCDNSATTAVGSVYGLTSGQIQTFGQP